MRCAACGRRAKEGTCSCGAQNRVRREGEVGRQISTRPGRVKPKWVVVNGQMERANGR